MVSGYKRKTGIKLKTKKNSRVAEIGHVLHDNVNFICFYGSVLARLSYFDDSKFAHLYANIFGHVIPLNVLKCINNSSDIMNDKLTFPDIISDTSDYVDFNALNMPQRINNIIGESGAVNSENISAGYGTPGYLKYISLAWSRYGEVYIIADTRMPDCMWVLFRGTYSNKTAASYTKVSSIIPLSACKPGEKFLLGIFEITVECIHMIIEAMNYLAGKYLNMDAKVYVCGHSLGSAMATIFTYLWQGLDAKRKSRFHKTVCCLSYGSPRCFNTDVSVRFCEYIKQGNILFKRIVTRGDPVPALPSKYIPGAAYAHPCSTNDNILPLITLNCGDTTNYTAFSLQPKYNNNLACKTKKQSGYLAVNPVAHGNYLNILYLKAMDPVAFLAGFFRWTTREVVPDTNGNSVCRLIMFNGSVYKVGFYQMKPVSSNHKGVSEDIFVTRAILKGIISKGKVINKKGVLPVNVPMDGTGVLINQINMILGAPNKSLVC